MEDTAPTDEQQTKPDYVILENGEEVSREFAEALGASEVGKEAFNDKDLYDMAQVIADFSEKMIGMTLYPYQREMAVGIAFSLLREDAEELTMLVARQGGKTEALAIVVPALMLLLPILSKAFPNEPRLVKYKDGFITGIFGPNADISSIMHSRMKSRLYSDSAKKVLADPEVDMKLWKRSQKMVLPNGSRVDCNTAAVGAKIEGKTYHLIIIEECQDVDDMKVRKSIHPMGAATAATIVKIGTPVPHTCEFEQACSRNKRRDLEITSPFAGIKFHYEYDYRTVMKYNPRYVKYISQEIRRLGEESDEFRMAYKLHWLVERGKFISEGRFAECGIREREVLKEWVVDRTSRKGKKKLEFVRPAYPTTSDMSSFAQVAGIDFGKNDSRTVVTVARVWWDNPLVMTTADDDEEERFYVHIQNWLELHGDDYPAQIPQIVGFLQNYNVGVVVCDSTGPGDPITSFLATELPSDVEVEPFNFNSSSKDRGYKILMEEMVSGRLTYPAGSRATRTQKWKRFRQQMLDLEKRYRGGRLVVERPNVRGAHDDFPDSLMLVEHGVTSFHEASREVEIGENPFVGRQAHRDLAMFSKRRWNGRVRVGMADRFEAESGQRPIVSRRNRGR